MIYSLFAQSGTGFALASRQLFLDKYRGAVAIMALTLVLACSAIAGSPMASAQDAATPAPVTTVNINTADALTLAAALKGVGESRAHEIVRYREAYGPFSSADELMEVKGIGRSTLDTNLKVITLE